MPEPLLAALAEAVGAAVVLDPQLRIVGFTHDAQELAGGVLERGVSAPRLLCGEGPERPVAEALAAGRAVTARIRRPRREGGDRVVRVRAVPLGEGHARAGWLLLLDLDAFADEAPDAPVVLHGILTADSRMKTLLRDLEKVARSPATVLVRGETGSGKELVARAIHALSPRARRPFAAINCAALPAALLESELFGHVRGAFTGAVRDVPGHFQAADGGTLLLDEVAEMPLELQPKLLRVLQERTVIPVGGRTPVPVDVRVIAATHRSLRQAVEEGRFRDDLMYRLRVLPIFLPPLRERPADVAVLASHFVERANARGERRVDRIAPGALAALSRHGWPGNVRELENAIEYAFVMGAGPVLTLAELPPEVRGDEPAPATVPVHEPAGARELDPEARRIAHALERASGHRARAAKTLGISRVTLWRKMRRHGLEPHTRGRAGGS